MISDDLKARRRKLGLTQKQLAKIMLVTERSLQRWEAGDTIHPMMRNGWLHTIEDLEEKANA